MAVKNASRARSHSGSHREPHASPPRSGAAAAFDPLVHERMRLGLLSALAANQKLSFNELKRILNTTDGNLSVHARKLEEAGYVQCAKFFHQRIPKTEFRLTLAGRRALERYLDGMEELIRTARGI